MSERRGEGIPRSSETQAEPTGWEAEPESTHGSERGPSGPAPKAPRAEVMFL